MNLTITQIFLFLFLLFALSRVILRFKSGEVSSRGLIFWGLLFSSAIVVVIVPELSGKIATVLGIGRGADAVIYTSIVLLFYLVFRLYVYIQDIRYEISDLVKKLALKDIDEKKPSKSARH
ncbi:hypothetical protein A3D78_06830 [Candidatus Gottesmanbacteria bacterium RIFCSPHIGHO2_02_FULL_39_14]|uniref:DUF2304 domain-containing protein n=3 Tax=Candidatus Gottesmaniibacteriota TaxID=1752720 RepID=A0A1F5ZV15_9BACT|nr:MAG: hypothetical protein A2153_03280 [Candidatus Gottesmanbacteria bacterium RBG_16_38_7b]OGG16318.1 MAG: hypothetical protein A3D78_06830 [Candidatus Gottesmanbacteria bacterium RIFCSPHIGHO2_02_FULL_39_14]OGG31394.1 MAG: hypothetical protein A3I51_03570 [Candidatus Gottesmanbacteria bacterium RIFCSPLOWO2_02_FULL_38_8]